MPSPLFRPEVIAARSGSWLGGVRLTQPGLYHLWGASGLVVAAALASFAAWGSYTRKATVPGHTVPAAGAIRITHAGGPALVAEVRVGEGATVAAGDPLVVLTSERMTDLGGAQALLAAELARRAEAIERDRRLSAERAAERRRAVGERLSALARESASLREEAALLAERARIAERQWARQRDLALQGFVSAAVAEARRDEWLLVRAQAEASERNRAALERERQQLTAQLREIELAARAEASDLDRAAALLAQERTEHAARSRLLVTAPAAGTVTGIAASVGQPVQPGAVLATLLPATEANAPALEAHFFATTRQAGFIAVGQRVRIRYAAYPYQKFGMAEGEVIEVSQSPYAVAELPLPVAALLAPLAQVGEAVYRIRVRLEEQTIGAWGERHRLKPGLVAEADILQDKRRLWEWMFEPLLSVSGRHL
jgi:membrane fusion protein